MDFAEEVEMKALSILQPWAWLIVRPDLTDPMARAAAHADGLIKDIENRTWGTSFRGEFLVHAGKTYSRRDHEDYAEWLADEMGIVLPKYEAMPRGGVVGKATVADCVKTHPSRWKMPDTHGFVLAGQQPLPFVPWRGQLGWFDIPESTLVDSPPFTLAPSPAGGRI